MLTMPDPKATLLVLLHVVHIFHPRRSLVFSTGARGGWSDDWRGLCVGPAGCPPTGYPLLGVAGRGVASRIDVQLVLIIRAGRYEHLWFSERCSVIFHLSHPVILKASALISFLYYKCSCILPRHHQSVI